MRSATPSSSRRLSKPVPRTLSALAEIAAAIATGETVGAVVPGVLSSVATQLDGTQATLWLRGLDGLRRAWSVAQDATTAEAVVELNGLKSYPYVVIPHPIASDNDAELRDKAEASVARIVAVLTERD